MLRKDNPYSPGAGRKPMALVGRDLQIDTWLAELERIEKGLDSRPMALYGLKWNSKASARVVELSDGYPYFLQEYGSECWLAAPESPINIEDVKRAEINAHRQLDAGFFVARWDRTTESQKEYMFAMARIGDNEVRTSEIAQLLKVPTTSLSLKRSELIKKGLIYAPRHGVVAFTVPLMADFIKRQTGFEG